MTAMAPVPADHPLMIAWNAFKDSEEYPNVRKWGQYPQHIDGSLWAAFSAGFAASLHKEQLTPEEAKAILSHTEGPDRITFSFVDAAEYKAGHEKLRSISRGRVDKT